MSPASSTHSLDARKPSTLRIGDPGFARRFRWRLMRQRRRPEACNRKTSYESMCAPTPPPSVAKLTIRSSSRASGTNRKRDSKLRAESSRRSTPCTNSVQRARLVDGRRRNGPCFSDRRRPNAAIKRLSACGSRASSKRRDRSIGAVKPGSAARINSGLRCQYWRMNCCTLIEPSRRRIADRFTE